MRIARGAVPAAWAVALVVTLLFARPAFLPLFIVGTVLSSAWWALLGGVARPRQSGPSV